MDSLDFTRELKKKRISNIQRSITMGRDTNLLRSECPRDDDEQSNRVDDSGKFATIQLKRLDTICPLSRQFEEINCGLCVHNNTVNSYSYQ